MAPSYVKVTDLRVGLAVEYLGKSDPVPVLDEKLQAIGMVLYSGHPGRIWSTLVQHVQVTWASLEDEPATYAVGFSVPDDDETGNAPSRTASQAGETCPAGFRHGPAATHRHDQPDTCKRPCPVTARVTR